MWTGVTNRFRVFRDNTRLTDDQVADGVTKSKGIISTLNRAYYDHNDELANGFWVGSWGKTTQARPPRDIDMFFKLPAAEYQRIQGLAGNKQSALLQEVKNILQVTYPQTNMRGDGQVVVINFNTVMVEVLPCFQLQDGRFYICDTHSGGSWTTADPGAEILAIQNGDRDSNGNLRNLIRMAKIWKRECNVPLKSYILETLATQFLAQSSYARMSLFWYDFIMRDFFAYLVSRGGGWITVPDGQAIPLGDEWKSRAETARDRALRACEHELHDRIPEAGDEWQKIFGSWIPKHATLEV